MPEIGAYEAKTHLPKLLERIKKGERFTITKHGRPVAELVPVTRKDPEAVRHTINRIRSYRETLRKRGVSTQRLLKKNETLRDLAHVGHRY
ncbi:MAG TPA: type II toxin-antitoxin system prevent-host-death family antitoxin [Nitrospirales bacterium]|nr:type II toxin-antitoxin system prevent-host-death family antitoxin [Nitrospirales bacterium]